MAERINKENYAEKTKAGLVLVDFYSDSCIPCKKLNPVLGDAEEELKGSVSFYKVNTNFDLDIAKANGVASTPTLVLLKDGKELDRKSGFLPKEVLQEWLKEKL